jgi:uncharacterized protein
VDTSAWYALAATGDARHSEAVRTLEQLLRDSRDMLTTNHVISESYTLLRIRLGVEAAHEFLRRTRLSLSVQRLFVPEAWEDAAEEILVQYRDQSFSYVDAISFVTMQNLSVHQAFAFDAHFITAGFTMFSAQQ